MSLLINKPLEICLKTVGIWPFSSNYIGPLALMSILVTTLPFQCWNALSLIENPILLMDSLSDIFTEILIFIKLFTMWINKRKIKELLREIVHDWDKKVLPERWKILARYCSIFCFLDLALYFNASIPYYFEIITRYMNSSIVDKPMIFKSQYPFDYNSFPIYEIINIMQVIQGALMILVDSLTKSLLVAYILHVVARVHQLECFVKEYSQSCLDQNDSDNESEHSGKLNLIIREHLNILIMVKKVDAVYRYTSLFQIVFSNLIICVTGFVIVTAFESANMMLLIKFISFIIAMLSQSFTFCFIGQYLRDKGELIIFMIYNCFWYNRRPNEVKTIMFVISNAQKPLTLSGGKLFELSTRTFVQILKTSFSYLSVLRAMYST